MLGDLVNILYVWSSILVSVLTLLIMFRKYLRFRVNSWLESRIRQVVTPLLTNDDTTVANYAHQAAEAAGEAAKAASAAREAAIAAREAALQARDITLRLQENSR